MIYRDRWRKIRIQATNIEIGDDVKFGKNIDIQLHGDFSIGDRSRLGNNVRMRGRNITIGTDLYNSGGLEVGGGGNNHPHANLTIGDRCTVHNNEINICESVTIGNHVGLSKNVDIYTHGYWGSVLLGFPALFAPVHICDGVIIYAKASVQPGVTIGENAVILTGTMVYHDVKGNCIYGGAPQERIIREITPLTYEQRMKKTIEIIKEYTDEIAPYHGIHPSITISYPIITVNTCSFNVESLQCFGMEDEVTDDFRDFVRHYGLWFYTNRPFKSIF